MLWQEVLDNWENGIVFTYPPELNGNRFQWNTSVLKNEGNCAYIHKFKINTSMHKTIILLLA